VPIRVLTEDEEDTLSEFTSVKSIQKGQPISNLTTTTSTELPFEGDRFSVNLHKLNPPPPPEPSPRSKQHKHEKRVSKSTRSLYSTATTEMHLFEGGDTWEDMEGLDKTWIVPIDGNSLRVLDAREIEN
jgi:hypothetical protein